MKKLILLLGILIMVFNARSQYVSTQKVSKLKPTLIIWEVNGEKITLKKAKAGIMTPSELYLEIYIDTNYVKTHQNLEFEVLWFYYLSTRRKLMNTIKIDINDAVKEEDAYVFKVKFSNMTKGWWEAQIKSVSDKGFLQYGNLTRFQIYLK